MVNKPCYTAVVAVSIDGKIARYSGHFSDWTSKEDKDFLHSTLDDSDVIIVGNITYQLAIEPLQKRNCIVISRSVNTTKKINPLLSYCNPENMPLDDLIRKLGYKKVHILGGTQVYSYCLAHDIIDELYLTIEPKIFGKGLSIFDVDYQSEWKLETMEKLNNNGTILLKYIKK